MTYTPSEREILRQAAKVRKAARERRPAPKADRKAVRSTPKLANPRQPRERDPGFLAFLRRLPCVAGMVEGGCSGPVEAAHLRFSDASVGRVNPGMGRKPSDKWATSLCRGHHQHDQHMKAERAFWERLGIDPNALSQALYAAYREGRSGEAVLRQFKEHSA
jgi:hypothetical protein